MKCKNCGNDTNFIPNFVHESVEENLEVTHDVHECPLCYSIHYKENGYEVFEKFVNIKPVEIKMLVTDYNVATKKEEEYAEEV